MDVSEISGNYSILNKVNDTNIFFAVFQFNFRCSVLFRAQSHLKFISRYVKCSFYNKHVWFYSKHLVNTLRSRKRKSKASFLKFVTSLVRLASLTLLSQFLIALTVLFPSVKRLL